MKDTAAFLKKSFIEFQEDIPTLAAMTPTHGLKRIHKLFWSKKIINLQKSIIELLKLIELWNYPTPELPFDGANFEQIWTDWKIYYYEETGKFLQGVKERTQLKMIKNYCETITEAEKTLDYLINKGYTHIFKVNFKYNKKENEKPNDINYLNEEDYE